jgi:hypothetical protein
MRLPNHDEVATHQCTWCPCHALLLPMASLPYPARSPATWSPLDRPMQCWCLCQHCPGDLARIALAVSPALRCCLYRHCTGVTALVAWASLPSSHWTLHPHCTRVAISIANWCLLRHDAIVTRQRTWRHHCAHCNCLWFLSP